MDSVAPVLQAENLHLLPEATAAGLQEFGPLVRLPAWELLVVLPLLLRLRLQQHLRRLRRRLGRRRCLSGLWLISWIWLWLIQLLQLICLISATGLIW